VSVIVDIEPSALIEMSKQASSANAPF